MRAISVFAVAALLAAALPAKADVLVSIDKGQQRMTVVVDGAPTYNWIVSTGRPGYDTPTGSYRAIRLERVYFSKKFDDAPMPNSVFFYGGYAIHGTYEEGKLGRPVSHGCVRLARHNAETLFSLVRARGMSNVRIVINDTGYRMPMADIRNFAPGTRAYDDGYRASGYRQDDYRGYRQYDRVPPGYYRPDDYRAPPSRQPDYRQPDYRSGGYRQPDERGNGYRQQDYRTGGYRPVAERQVDERRSYRAPPPDIRYGRGLDPYDNLPPRFRKLRGLEAYNQVLDPKIAADLPQQPSKYSEKNEPPREYPSTPPNGGYTQVPLGGFTPPAGGFSERRDIAPPGYGGGLPQNGSNGMPPTGAGAPPRNGANAPYDSRGGTPPPKAAKTPPRRNATAPHRNGAPPPPRGRYADRGPPPRDFRDERGPPPRGYSDRGPPPRGYGDRGPPPRGYNDRGPPPRGYSDRGPPPRGHNDRGPPPRGYSDRGPPPGGHNDRGPQPPRGYSDRGPPPRDYRGGPPSRDERGAPPRGYGDRGPPPRYADRGPPPSEYRSSMRDERGPPPRGYSDRGPPPRQADRGPPPRDSRDRGPPPGYGDRGPPPSGARYVSEEQLRDFARRNKLRW